MPLGRVAFALGSYADQASCIAVWSTAMIRDVTVGPGGAARTAASAVLFHWITTLSLLGLAQAVPTSPAANAATNAAPPRKTPRRFIRRCVGTWNVMSCTVVSSYG